MHLAVRNAVGLEHSSSTRQPCGCRQPGGSERGALSPFAVIIGGGIVGCSIAYNLASRGCSDILLVERHFVGAGATGRCVGGIYFLERDPLDCRLSTLGYHAHSCLSDQLDAPTDFRPVGSLTVFTDPIDLEQGTRTARSVRERGLDAEVVRRDRIRAILPCLRVDDLAGGIFCREYARADPHAVTQ